jgi:hypothetical protein
MYVCMYECRWDDSGDGFDIAWWLEQEEVLAKWQAEDVRPASVVSSGGATCSAWSSADVQQLYSSCAC